MRTEKAAPSCKDLRTVLYAALLELHSHTKQAVVDDLLDDQTLTLFGLHLPARLFRADNSAQREVALAAALRSLNSVLAEPVQDVIMGDGNGDLCLEARTPLDLEADLGLLGGNIFHRSLQWPWAHTEADVGTWGVETSYERLLVCGAGARRGGGASGILGHNGAQRVLEMYEM